MFLIDQSASMNEVLAGGNGQDKKDAVAERLNRLVYDIIMFCSREDGVRSYFDIGIWAYGGHNTVQSLLDEDIVKLESLADKPLRMETSKKPNYPVWVEPVASGNTPMTDAFRTITNAAASWIASHSESFPPVVINLTDGESTDGDPTQAANELSKLRTADGNILLFNCHITEKQGAVVRFPNDNQARVLQDLAKTLYDISSVIPESMRRYAVRNGLPLEEGARGYVFNADMSALTDFLSIGTRAVLTQVAK